MGDQRLCARLRGLPAPGRTCGRHPRPQAHVHRRARRVHVGVAPRGARVERALADRRPRHSGPRRGDHRAGGAVDPHDDLRRRQGAQHRARRLGRGRRLRSRSRRAARRRLHRPPELGVDLLHQPPGRDHRAGARARAPRREPRPHRAGLRRPRCGARHRRPLGGGVRDHAGERLGLELRADDRRLRRGRRAAGRLRRPRDACRAPAHVVLDLPDQDGRGCEHRRVHPRHGAVLDVPDADALHAAGARLLAAEDGRRVHRRRRRRRSSGRWWRSSS